jgi:transposase
VAVDPAQATWLAVICIDAGRVKRRIRQTGWFKEIGVKDLDSHSVRALLASPASLVKIKRDLANQIRGLLKNLGLAIGRPKFNVFGASRGVD